MALSLSSSLFLLQVLHTDDGLEAIIFTAQGDLRQVQHSPLCD